MNVIGSGMSLAVGTYSLLFCENSVSILTISS